MDAITQKWIEKAYKNKALAAIHIDLQKSHESTVPINTFINAHKLSQKLRTHDIPNLWVIMEDYKRLKDKFHYHDYLTNLERYMNNDLIICQPAESEFIYTKLKRNAYQVYSPLVQDTRNLDTLFFTGIYSVLCLNDSIIGAL